MHGLAPHPPLPIVATPSDAAAVLETGVSAGAALVRGLPIGPLGPTPNAMCPARADAPATAVLLDAARRLGTPVGYVQEHGGEVVQNIFPLADSVGQQISTSSDVPLAFHTETAFHPHRSRFLVLLCLRGDPSAATTLCSVDAVAPLLPEDVIATLGEPRFRTGVDLSFGRGDGWMTDPAPVIGRADDGSRTLTYDAELTEGIDAGAAAALATLADAIARTYTSVVLSAGDLLMVDNRRAVHGRSDFRARFDGTDRWLLRTFVVEDLATITQRRGHVITTRFSTAA